MPRTAGAFSFYVCGPTVYDVPHLGHGRSVLVFDVLRRYVESTGLAVVHVANITDVDDKIIQRAQQEDRTAAAVAGQFEELWWDVVDRLGALRPTRAPRATEYVGHMIDLVGELVAAGAAYETPGGVYLATGSVPGYGLLAHQQLDELRTGARVEVDEHKQSPTDFALWRRDEPSEAAPAWPSPWGPGRPGWHTECVVMSLDLLGEGFDLHGGGLDLRFPHHENERAQAVALGREFAHVWMHHGFVEVEGEKMSKSLGNFTSLVDLLDRTDARAFRLLVLRSHYRSPLEVTPASVADAETALGRLDAVARRFPEALSVGAGLPRQGAGPTGGETVVDEAEIAGFRSSMDDDLDTPAAVSRMFDLIRRANATADAGDGAAALRLAATVVVIARTLGLEPRGPQPGAGQADDEATDLIRRRDAARAARDFAAADALRDELHERGWIVEDGPEGTRVRRDPSS